VPGNCFVPLDYDSQEMRLAGHYALVVPDAFEHRFTWRCTLAKRGDCKGRGPHGPKEIHVGRRSDWKVKPRVGIAEGFLSAGKPGPDGKPIKYSPHDAMVTRCAEMGIPGIDRTRGKTANFAIVYGAFPDKIAETLDCSHQIARDLFDIFWGSAYAELGHTKAFIEERLRQAGPMSHWSGAKSLRTLHGGEVFLSGAHKGLNYVVQRSCREILLQAMLSVDAFLKAERPAWRIVFPVHDELVLHAPVSEVQGAGGRETVQHVARLMVAAGAASRVPMKVAASLCLRSWAHKEELGPDWGWDGVLQGVTTP
jgi:hypothetical protein